MAQKNYDLIKAGAWVYDITNQEKQANALEKAWLSSSALLAKYTLVAPRDGVVMAVNVTPGSFVSNQGAYDQYTEGAAPLMALGSPRRLAAMCAATWMRFWCRACRRPAP